MILGRCIQQETTIPAKRMNFITQHTWGVMEQHPSVRSEDFVEHLAQLNLLTIQSVSGLSTKAATYTRAILERIAGYDECSGTRPCLSRWIWIAAATEYLPTFQDTPIWDRLWRHSGGWGKVACWHQVDKIAFIVLNVIAGRPSLDDIEDDRTHMMADSVVRILATRRPKSFMDFLVELKGILLDIEGVFVVDIEDEDDRLVSIEEGLGNSPRYLTMARIQGQYFFSHDGVELGMGTVGAGVVEDQAICRPRGARYAMVCAVISM